MTYFYSEILSVCRCAQFAILPLNTRFWSRYGCTCRIKVSNVGCNDVCTALRGTTDAAVVSVAVAANIYTNTAMLR